MQTYDNMRSLQISDTPHVVSVTNIRNRKGVFFFLYIRGNEQQVAVRQTLSDSVSMQEEIRTNPDTCPEPLS